MTSDELIHVDYVQMQYLRSDGTPDKSAYAVLISDHSEDYLWHDRPIEHLADLHALINKNNAGEVLYQIVVDHSSYLDDMYQHHREKGDAVFLFNAEPVRFDSRDGYEEESV